MCFVYPPPLPLIANSRFLYGALVKWKTGKHVAVALLGDKTVASEDYVIRGAGGRLLLDAEASFPLMGG